MVSTVRDQAQHCLRLDPVGEAGHIGLMLSQFSLLLLGPVRAGRMALVFEKYVSNLQSVQANISRQRHRLDEDMDAFKKRRDKNTAGNQEWAVSIIEISSLCIEGDSRGGGSLGKLNSLCTRRRVAMNRHGPPTVPKCWSQHERPLPKDQKFMSRNASLSISSRQIVDARPPLEPSTHGRLPKCLSLQRFPCTPDRSCDRADESRSAASPCSEVSPASLAARSSVRRCLSSAEMEQLQVETKRLELQQMLRRNRGPCGRP